MMGETFTSTKESPEGTAIESAEIPIGAGVWEISSLHVILGGAVPVVTVTNAHGLGSVRFEQEGAYATDTAKEAHAQRLVSGHCTLVFPMILEHPCLVVGPGILKSYIYHQDSVAHSMTATYRRVYG